MSWLYSRALAAEYLAGTCSDGELSALSRRMTTPRAYCSPDRMKGCSRLSRFGMTYEPLTDDLGGELLTWFLAGSRVRTSASQGAERDSTARSQGSGPKWLASWAKYDRASCSWKTAQLSFLEDLGASSVTWPRSGLMRRGECYPLRTVGLGTRENASGLLPTLVADDTSSRTKPYAQGGMPLSLAVKLVPNTRLRTLMASDADKWSRQSVAERIAKGQQVRINHQLGGGPLNPTWCEWFMGVPQGWTEFAALGISRFQEWRQQHSLNFQPSLSDAA